MTKRLSLNAKLAQLDLYKAGPLPLNAAKELSKFLADANHIVVAYAAEIAARYERRDLIADLAAAFNRLIPKPAKADVGCMAKIAIVKALDKLEYSDSDQVFYQGIHHVQIEPAYNERIDTAAELRGRCALGLARIGHPEIFFLLAALLMDPEPQARTGAVRSLIYLGTHESELLLRMKILAGEKHPDLLSECFSGLIQIDSDHSIDFVAQFLDSTNLITMENAAIAVGESRSKRAFEFLVQHRDTCSLTKIKQVFLLPIALTKQEEAFAYLLEVIENEHEESAAYAVEALRVFGVGDAYRKQIHQVVTSRHNKRITEVYLKYFSRHD